MDEQFKQELAMIEQAIATPQDELAFRTYITPAVEQVVEEHVKKYQSDRSKANTGAWKYFNKALHTYYRRALRMLDNAQDQNRYHFVDYFRWYIRQGIIEETRITYTEPDEL